jgi:hypothetical protein
MHKTPSQIARSLRAFLRAFRNANRLGLLRGVLILPGVGACEAARSQQDTEYRGDIVPRLPLPRCTRDRCECKYAPHGTPKLRGLDIAKKPPTESRRH